MLCLACSGSSPDAPKSSGARQALPRAQRAEKRADNSYCLVCHVNYEDEELTRTHTRVGVGCEKCHGRSSKHSADEDGLTPPDIMYPRGKIKPFCLSCHQAEKIKDEKDHKEILAPKPPASAKTCTQCHGKHQIKVRTRVWDKGTGKLISDDGVRMMQPRKPETLPADKPKAPTEKERK